MIRSCTIKIEDAKASRENIRTSIASITENTAKSKPKSTKAHEVMMRFSIIEDS